LLPGGLLAVFCCGFSLFNALHLVCCCCIVHCYKTQHQQNVYKVNLNNLPLKPNFSNKNMNKETNNVTHRLERRALTVIHLFKIKIKFALFMGFNVSEPYAVVVRPQSIGKGLIKRLKLDLIWK
jgi:Sec-independent protein secretion pathway component TatC